MKYQLVIFDLDGTVLDTLADLTNALNYALEKNGFPKRSLSEVRSFVGNGIRKLIERGVPFGTDNSAVCRVHECFTTFYTTHCADNTRPYDGIPELLLELKSKGVKCAVVSNKADYAVQSLCEKYFPGMFCMAVGEREGVRKKPAPDSVNEVLQAFGGKLSDAVYIGDSEVDIQTALNASLGCISVCWGFRDKDFLKKSGAGITIDSVAELKKMLTE